MNKTVAIGVVVGLVGIGGAGFFIVQQRAELQRVKAEAEAKAAQLEQEQKAELLKQQELQKAELLKQQELLSSSDANAKWDRFKQNYKMAKIEVERAIEKLGPALESLTTDPSQAHVDAALDEFDRVRKVFTDVQRQAEEVAEFRKSDGFKHIKNPDNEEVFKTDSLAKVNEVLAAFGSIRKGVKHERMVVRADDGWQSTSLAVESKDQVFMQSSGQWRWAQMMGTPVTGPQGVNETPGYRVEPAFNNAALLVKVEGASEIFSGWGSFTAPRSGKLQFRINDRDLADNGGSVAVEIWVLSLAKLSELMAK